MMWKLEKLWGMYSKWPAFFSTELKYSVPWLQSETSAMIFRETDAILRWRRNLKHFLSAWNDSWLERSMWWFHFIRCALKFWVHIFLLQINIPFLTRGIRKLINHYKQMSSTRSSVGQFFFQILFESYLYNMNLYSKSLFLWWKSYLALALSRTNENFRLNFCPGASTDALIWHWIPYYNAHSPGLTPIDPLQWN